MKTISGISPRGPTGFAASAAIALAIALPLALEPAPAQGGVFRDVLASVGLAKPSPPPAPPPGSGLPRHGFACCNLHFDKDWINDGNYAKFPMIPAGTPIEVQSYGKNRAFVSVDGKPMKLGHDYGRDQETLDQWVNKIVVGEDPRPRITRYPRPVQEAIQAGKLMVGMTREQAIVAIGYPLTSENGPLESSTWKMWRSSHGEYDLNFGPDGHLTSITGDDEAVAQMVYKPAP
jgi:hypothetical protein